MQNMMKQMQKMQKKMAEAQEELGEKKIEGYSWRWHGNSCCDWSQRNRGSND